MDEQLKKQWRWFWAWQDVEEEAWLRSMARQGWHLESIGFPGIYTFQAGEPRDDVYRLDYLKERKDFVNYLQLFQDAGWERVGEYNNWQYFRTRNVGSKPPEIFSDTTSKILKYRRVMNGLLAFQPIFIIMIIFARSGNPIYPFIAAIGIATMLGIGTSIIMLYRRINQLKK